MRRYLYIGILFLSSTLKAEMGKDVIGFPIGSDLNYSSTTCVGTPNPSSTIISTAASSELYVISITSAGSADSFFMVFDTSGTPSANLAAAGSTTTARVITRYAQGTPVRDISYRRHAFKNGIGVYIAGVITPCMDIKYNSR